MTIPSGQLRALRTSSRTGAVCCAIPRYQSSTCWAASSTVSAGGIEQAGHPRTGRAAPRSRLASRASRSLMSCKRAGSLASIPFSINCLWRRRARSSGLAVRNTLSAASGNTTEPMSRPSATSPGGCRNARWRSSSAARTGWQRRHPRGGGRHFLGTDRLGHRLARQEHRLAFEAAVERPWPPARGPPRPRGRRPSATPGRATSR